MRKTLAVLAATSALLTFAACEVPEEEDKDGDGVSSMTSEEYAKHVKIDSCAADQFGTITAKLVIKNKSKKQLSYVITAEAVNAKGERITELNGIANNVRAGQTTHTDALGMVDDNSAKFTCKIVNVETM